MPNTDTAVRAEPEAAASAPLPDVIAALAAVRPGSALDGARARRAAARDHAQGSFAALFVPDDASHVTLAERAAVALFVARLHEQPEAVEFYGALLRETGRGLAAGAGAALEPLIVAEASRAAGAGPYGDFRAENAPESVSGPEYRVSSIEAAYALGDRLAAALEHAHFLVLHPRDASRAPLQALLDAGWSTTGIVTLSQLVAFLTFQLRVVRGLLALAADGAERGPESAAEGAAHSAPAGAAPSLSELAATVARAAERRSGAATADPSPETAASSPAIADPSPGGARGRAPEQLPPPPRVTEPPRFTQDVLGWKPWLEPLAASEFTERHYEALVERERVHMPYFRLLARDPEALRERTLTDLDIFHNADAGLPRAEREFTAAAASRFNGCVFCASVHARFATEQGADRAEVQRLLDEGVGARISPRLDALVDATVALTETPARFGADQIAGLRAIGLGDLEVLDVVQAGAFFNWANRLMLSLGEPTT